MPLTTRIDIPAATRKKAIALLNQNLADAIDLGLQAKQAHWNVKGPSFIALHELFDKVAESAEEAIDEIAERITALGGVAEGTVQVVAKKSRLDAYPLDISAGRDHVNKLADAIAAVGKNARAAIDESDKLGDKDTADLFTGISRELDKYLWFVEAHVQASE
ncbi:MAG: DNA starvation/stationary phase protection protein Dps [Pirellulaceae bacterium]|nr:DNA starvation/stationary phase protection protein Dps [Pirellulaceae bacterium]